MLLSAGTFVVAFALLSSQTVLAQGSLPQVDLGYEIHQAISLNVGIRRTKIAFHSC